MNESSTFAITAVFPHDFAIRYKSEKFHKFLSSRKCFTIAERRGEMSMRVYFLLEKYNVARNARL